MLTIIGPAKTIKNVPHPFPELNTFPEFLDRAEHLVNKLRLHDIQELMKLMSASRKIAELNFERYASWTKEYSEPDATPAILGFSGEVFNGLQANSLNKSDLEFAQKHLRILSGLYGVLRPNDLILPYRLEMGTRFKTEKGKDLYAYWKTTIPEEIIQATSETENNCLLNLASNEYFKSINPKGFPFTIITPVFKEAKGDSYRNVTIYAKKARGMMLRFLLQHKITDPENIKAFDEEGYYYNPDMSTELEWWFTR